MSDIERGWWSQNIFDLKKAWIEAGGKWTDQECRIIEAREKTLLSPPSRYSKPKRTAGPT